MLEFQHFTENPPRSSKPSHLPRTPLQPLTSHSIIPNPQFVPLYFTEIFSFLKSSEPTFHPSSTYFSQQPEINHTSRAFLINWLVTIHQKFKLLQETLYITVNLLDRYLSQRTVTKKQFQLVGITAMFIASKYEEIYPPRAKDFLVTTENAFTKQHLVRMEIDMLKVVEFQIAVPTAWRFVEKYLEIGEGVRELVEYVLELGLGEFCMMKYKASVQAEAVVYLASVVVNRVYLWKIEEEEVRECVKDFCKIFKGAKEHPLVAVREKYLRKKVDILRYENEL